MSQAAWRISVIVRGPDGSDRECPSVRKHGCCLGEYAGLRCPFAPFGDFNFNTDRGLPDGVSRNGSTDVATEQKHRNDPPSSSSTEVARDLANDDAFPTTDAANPHTVVHVEPVAPQARSHADSA